MVKFIQAHYTAVLLKYTTKRIFSYVSIYSIKTNARLMRSLSLVMFLKVYFQLVIIVNSLNIMIVSLSFTNKFTMTKFSVTLRINQSKDSISTA